LAPRPHLVSDGREVGTPPEIHARLFSKTRNINQRPAKPFVLSAELKSAGADETDAPRRAAFPAGVFRRAEKAGPKDPAPSRLRYRMHRLWLTPVYRAILRTGLPAFFVVFGVGLYLSDDGRREMLAGSAEAVIRSVQERPEFMVKLVSIEGASPELADTIRAAMPVRFPTSSFDLDLDALRQQVLALDAVASADLRVKPGGILELKVAERRPALVWRGPEGVVLLDDTGHLVAPIASRLDRSDLPVLAGDGADRAVPEALELLEAAAPVSARLRGLVRVGDRRWTVVLDNSQRILLPETGAVAALERVMALAMAEDMLSRGVSVVDMRYSARPTLRLSDAAMGQFRQSEETETGATSG
jgi:cell division protein FtsQ